EIQQGILESDQAVESDQGFRPFQKGLLEIQVPGKNHPGAGVTTHSNKVNGRQKKRNDKYHPCRSRKPQRLPAADFSKFASELMFRANPLDGKIEGAGFR